ncbi:TetR/AcrR family transcriptional regulator [Actinomycetospora cinnamomea]|uniref:TetR/AcrR family transcriptional regulator n=1 Tax=Actinomycetospora cinnamomea TaxID=663609 RepID=UPI001FAFEA20|nr:TetR/AcrR family transcriptional regulator [Actinomycetospora cinnamomea]
MTRTGDSRGRERRGRARLRDAAYELFSREGVTQVGVDAVVARAGTAKMTLYRNFPSKDALVVDFLRERERRWTREWLEAESARRADDPVDQLLAIFDLFAEWFATPAFEGCAFISTLLEVRDPRDSAHRASVEHLAAIRGVVAERAARAGVAEPEEFARRWHIVMKGTIVAAQEGDRNAAAAGRELALLLLARHGLSPSEPSS